jgi:peptidyl-prolyl cis-trans isomerase C
MRRRTRALEALYILIGLALMAPALDCRDEGGKGIDVGPSAGEARGDEVLVRVGETAITRGQFEAELEKIPPFQRREMETPQGKQQFLDRLVEMELLYRAALAAGLDQDPALQQEVERARRQILMRQYYRTHVQDAAQPDSAAVQAYYDAHQGEFAVQERVRARWILAEDRAQATAMAKRLADGEDFAALARSESKDAPTATEDGDLGWFTRDGYVRSIGVSPAFTEQVFALAPGTVSAPIEVEKKGWAIVRIDEHEAARTKSLAEVGEEISRRLAPKVQEDLYAETLRELRERFGVEQVAAPFTSAATPEELFEMAQTAKDPRERIGYYEQMVERFPDFPQADRAQFMVGFVYAEELADTAQARAAFERFLTLYPDSDLGEDARYMLGALSGKEPAFEGD